MSGMQGYMEGKGYGWMFEVEESDDWAEQRPLLEELEIDFADIGRKIGWALRPPAEGVGLIEDFWGPVLVVCVYAGLVVWGQLQVVSWVLSLWLCGSALVFFSARVLGAELTFTHTLGTLGYCLLPLVASRLLLLLVGTAGVTSLLVRAAGMLWATWSGSRWLRTREIAHKRLLLAYPILLYTFFLTALATGV